MKLSQQVIAAALSVLSLAGGASAATVTLAGTHFNLSFDDALVGLFGTPTVVGDAISWSPTAFTAKTFSDIAFVDASTVLTITAKAGWTLNSFGLAEGGDYAFYGANNLVAAGGELRVTSLSGAVTTSIDNIDVTSGAFLAQASVLPFPTRKWTAAADLAVTTSKASVTVENLLFGLASDTTANDYAFIQKKNAVLTVGVSPVPEPESYALFLAGLGTLGFLARRRRG